MSYIRQHLWFLCIVAEYSVCNFHRSCDVGGKSHDQPDGSHDPGSKSHDQEEWLCEGSEVEGRGEVEECLGRAVDRWCEWGEGGEGEGEGEEERVLHFLRLTAELCHLTCQVHISTFCDIISWWSKFCEIFCDNFLVVKIL